MIVNDFEPVVPPPGPVRRRGRAQPKPNFLAVGLGVVCVIGVFAMLGLLYSFG
jgi:hypothetical protein